MKYDVFISKKSADKEIGLEICNFLESHGYKCFNSERDVSDSGDAAYFDVIDKALDSSYNMVVICSHPEYLETKWVKHEWQTFYNEKLSADENKALRGNIITIKLDSIHRKDLPISLRNLEIINYSDYKTRLIKYIKKETRYLIKVKIL